MTNRTISTKDTGQFGEKVAAAYLRRHGFVIRGQNIARKTGEIDILAEKERVLHFVEVKSLKCRDFPTKGETDIYTPGDNLHIHKIRKVVRTAEWLVAELRWKGEWQIDAIFVWIRKRDGRARIHFEPQIL